MINRMAASYADDGKATVSLDVHLNNRKQRNICNPFRSERVGKW